MKYKKKEYSLLNICKAQEKLKGKDKEKKGKKERHEERGLRNRERTTYLATDILTLII